MLGLLVLAVGLGTVVTVKPGEVRAVMVYGLLGCVAFVATLLWLWLRRRRRQREERDERYWPD